MLFFASCETEHLYGPGGILEGNPCDTVDVAYTTHIKPIIDRECVSCHNSTSASSNVILDSYTSVKSYSIF